MYDVRTLIKKDFDLEKYVQKQAKLRDKEMKKDRKNVRTLLRMAAMGNSNNI